MDEQQARQRLLEGGYFVALGVPPGVEFGIDLKSYKVCEVGRWLTFSQQHRCTRCCSQW